MAQLTIQQTFDLAWQHHQSGRLAQAEQMYRQILGPQPNHPDALYWLGVLALQVGRSDAAVDLIGRAVALRPNDALRHGDLGCALASAGRRQEAIAAYRQAIALKPDFPIAYCNLGNALRDKGQVDEAIAAYRQAIALQPEFPVAYSNLGNALADQGQLNEAVAAFRRAIVLKPDLAEVHHNLGNALKKQGQLEEAVGAFRRAIALRREFPEAHCSLGVALADQGQLDEAVAAYRQAIILRPELPEAHSNLGTALKDQGRLDEALASYRQALMVQPGYHDAYSNLLFSLHYHPGYDAAAIAAEHRRWSQVHAEPLAGEIRPHPNDRSPQRRLRIGYVSPDFSNHVVGRFCVPLLAHHDHQQFEIFCYSDASRKDGITERLQGHCDQWQDVRRLSDARLAEKIRGDGIDILVDLTLHTAGNRLLVFARKPAPVQVSYLAYCSTTGLATIDYRLSDPYLDAPGEDDSIYSERTIRLPETYWCYEPHALAPEVNALPALEHGRITFGCLNNPCKISERALRAWADLLRAIPQSRLLLLAHQGSHRQRVQERLAAQGIEPLRVQFASRMPIKEYFELHHQIDIALDTFPYAGGTTTCDALWMGVPVVSLVGKTAVGRGGLSILSNVGLPELAARSEQEYVRLARDLAHDLERLSRLRSTLRQRMRLSPLTEGPRFARNVEAAYRQMWGTWCQKDGDPRPDPQAAEG